MLPATTGSDSLTEDRVVTATPRVAGEEEGDVDIPADSVSDLIEEDEVKVDFHIEDSTIIYECVEKYLDVLNSDQRLRPEVSPVEKMIDEAVLCFETDIDKCKNLVNNYHCLLIKP